MPSKITVILSKDRNPGAHQQAMHDQLLAGLVGREDVQVAAVPHLYDLAPDGPSIRYLRAIRGDMVVLAWLYPRSSYWVLQANRVDGRFAATSSLFEEQSENGEPEAEEREIDEGRKIWCFDLRAHRRPERYLKQVDRILARRTAPVAERVAPSVPSEPVTVDEMPSARWYPVVDFSRCTHCGECLNFCLFGVFSVDDQERIVIEMPDACRPGCPACARICPSGAIMFPQHADPAIAGDPEKSLSGLKLDLSQIFSGAGVAEIAMAERQRALREKLSQEAAQDGLDDLVNRLDDMEL